MNCTLILYSKQHFVLCSRRDERRAVKKMEQVRSTPINFAISFSNLTYFSFVFFYGKNCKEGKSVNLLYHNLQSLESLRQGNSSIAYVYRMNSFSAATAATSSEYIDN